MFSVTIREKSGQVYTFHFDKPEIMIGRVKGNDVILPKQNISKRHALVRSHARASFIIEDLASTNGTYVNGHRITSPVEISAEDKVYLGDFVMQFFDLGEAQQEDEPAPEPPPEPAAQRDAVQDLFEGLQEAPAVPDVPETDEVLDIDDSALDEDPMAELARMMDEGRQEATRDLSGGSQPPALVDLDEEELEPTRAVAAANPDAALDALDDHRMTGPVDGLSDALEAATQAIPDFAPIPQLAEQAEQEGPAPSGRAAEVDAGRTGRDPARSVTRRSSAQPRPPVDDAYVAALAGLYDRGMTELETALPAGAAPLTESQWGALEERVVALVDAHAGDEALQGQDLTRIKKDLVYELAGLGPLEELLDDGAVETIAVNGPDRIYATRKGNRKLCGARFSSARAMATAVERLARATGITVTEQTTSATGTLLDGTSVRVIWPPLCPSGPVLLLRKPRASAPTLAELVRQGRVTGAVGTALRRAIQAGRSVAICGPLDAGRRTVLNAMALELSEDERIVVAEESVRIHLEHDNVVRLDGSAAGQEGAALIGLAAGLRPDRLLLGAMTSERTAELLDLACDGLAPWIAFFHARDAEDLLRRVVHGYALHRAGAPLESCNVRAAAALDVLAIFSESEGGAFVLDQVREVTLGVAGLGTRSLLDD